MCGSNPTPFSASLKRDCSLIQTATIPLQAKVFWNILFLELAAFPYMTSSLTAMGMKQGFLTVLRLLPALPVSMIMTLPSSAAQSVRPPSLPPRPLCLSPAAGLCVQGEVRLVGGNDTGGRVELCMDEEWGTVCSDEWSNTNARVVCRQLGFSALSEHIS